MDRLSLRLRGSALQRLAVLSARESTYENGVHEASSFERLASECTLRRDASTNGTANGYAKKPAETSQIPMSVRELEVLLALCKAAPALQAPQNAEKLLRQLSPYMIESSNQQFAPSPFLRDAEPSPWECLTSSVATAVLSIGLNFFQLRPRVVDTVMKYVRQVLAFCESMDGEDDVTDIARLVASLIGFLDSCSKVANFWTPIERAGLVEHVQQILSDGFLMDVDAAFDRIRNSQGKEMGRWRQYARHYDSLGRPIGAMLLQHGFMKLLIASTSLLVANSAAFYDGDTLDVIMDGHGVITSLTSEDFGTVELLSDLAAAGVIAVDESTTDPEIITLAGQQLAYTTKAHALSAYCNSVVLSSSADPNALLKWLQATIADPVQMSNLALANAVLKTLAILSKDDANSSNGFISIMHRFIVEGTPSHEVVKVAAKCLSYILHHSPQDATITTLNTMGHVLSSVNPERALKAETLQPFEQQAMGSTLSLVSNSEEFRFNIYCNVIETIVRVSSNCKDSKMISLANSILLQRLGKVTSAVSAKILGGLASLVPIASRADYKSISEALVKSTADAVLSDDHTLLDAALEARCFLAESITTESQLYELFLTDVLHSVAAIGDEREKDTEKKRVDATLAVREIEQYIRPLAILLGHNKTDVNFALRSGFTSLLRDFWLNCVVHGIIYGTGTAHKHGESFKIIAKYTPPLIDGVVEDQSFDADLDVHSLFKRDMSSANVVEHKRRLISVLPAEEVQIRTLTYPRTIFLEAAYSLECMRAEGGGCSKVLAYFVEPAFKTGDASTVMAAIAGKVTDIYITRILTGAYPDFCSSSVADQLADVFVGCCHRLEKVQATATVMADRIIATAPSALCRRASLFALLELLGLLWASCMKEETDEYATRAIFTSKRGRVAIEMPDSYKFRKQTMRNFRERAKTWVLKILNIAPLDMKGLLQTYLSEFEDEGSVGHVSLGRSFALEMGGTLPNTDRRLASIDFVGEFGVDVASDFIKQYTVRQIYRKGEHGTDNARRPLKFAPLGHQGLLSSPSTDSLERLIAQMDGKDYTVGRVPTADVRYMLRKAATLICSSGRDQGTLIRHLVGLPFAVFTPSAIKVGMLLWAGVVGEKPELSSRMLAEIARNFEMSVERKIGLFAGDFALYDAFDVKMEYAPSNKEEHNLEQQTAIDLLSPHLRLIQLLSSHYHANRHGNPHIQKIFLRLVRIALRGLKTATGHPLSREARFQLVLLALQVLRYSTGLTERQQTSLKDLIISGALSWFKFPPQWSFGGNKLQVKSEAHLLQDVTNFLNGISTIGAQSRTLRVRQDLLVMLLENEQFRLATWLYPLEHSRRHHLLPSYSARPTGDSSISAILPAAWAEDPAIAVQLSQRFPSERLKGEVRSLIMNYPEKVMHIPRAAQIMLGNKLSGDITFQLRYLLYWAPITPITASTYFLPSYANDPFILQYAMRSLESYSVDVTFFYVPQIVQTLRYDFLGYVERFILETAKFSQLFAHQIIWNMKANAYKDEDSTIPDPVKPTLDHVMAKLIESFSDADKNFYEREFDFFGEVTSISGKLRPYIRKTKPEKNEKIAEELAKIQVDVGVYLPSNPDSVVVDIDRKSGKSLQSHAKAPFMATFKIRRKTLGTIDEHEALDRHGRRHESTSTVTKEMMQAAIFKVGDDCRQDMLALQLIAAFRSIFNSVGLDVFVFPYRVTATAPGCGVIDVLPKSISRDMLGRDYDMGLYDYFINKYGGEDSIRFQEARTCFVKSMAAYSVISYLLKFKDRHNGNIMLDDAGHIIHIDFGFCFDIAPGGITFERAPFKLTAEMISVMGGSVDAQPYVWFEELCIKSFLVCRQYVDKLTDCVTLMLDSGLPCFKPETIQNFKDRFVLDKTDREAADYMRYLVKKSYSSYSTGQYDRFQHLTNGIPY